MPKMKTKSSVKKRFKFTSTGKIKHKAAGTKHGMVKHPKKALRKKRRLAVLCAADTKIVKLFMRQRKEK